MKIRGIDVEWLGHSGFIIEDQNGRRIAIDPFNIGEGIGKVDLILITHSHHDHCSISDMKKLAREGTHIGIPVDAQSKVNRLEDVNVHIITCGIKTKIDGTSIYPFAAYNTNKQFHPKDEGWMGYIIKLKDVIVYHAGDTDKIPEMKFLEFIAQEGEYVIALLPISGVYVMNAEEAAEAASEIKPALAIPMHYGAGVAGTEEDAKRFVELCKEKNIDSMILEKV